MRPSISSRRRTRLGAAAGALFLAASAVSSSLLLASGPAAVASATPVLPSATGGFGQKPTITFPSNAVKPTKIEEKVLHQGTGPVVKKSDLLVVNYLGQLWKGKVFGTSYGSDLAGFPIGLGKVIPGWDKTLVGQKIGSRVLLVLPPADGYGKTGNSQGGIPANSTLVFVVDLVASYSPKVGGDAHATVVKTSADGVTVGGPLGGKPTLSVAKNAAAPKSTKVVLLDRGHGAKVTPGLVVDQYVLDTWPDKLSGSSWSAGYADSEVVGDKSSPSPLDPFVGMPIGSRVLVELPKSSSGGPYVAVFDIVAEPHA